MEEKVFTLEEGTLRIDSFQIVIVDNSNTHRKRSNLFFGLNLLMCLVFLFCAARDNEFDQIVFWGLLSIVSILVFLFLPNESDLSEFLLSNIKSIKVKSTFSYTRFGNDVLLATIYTNDKKIRRVRIGIENNQEVEFLNTINSLGINVKGTVSH